MINETVMCDLNKYESIEKVCENEGNASRRNCSELHKNKNQVEEKIGSNPYDYLGPTQGEIHLRMSEKVFYHYYGFLGRIGFRTASSRQKNLHLHKKLTNRWMWMVLCHKAIEYLLKQHRQQAEIESLDYYLELITKRMRQDYRDSITHIEISRPRQNRWFI